MRKYITPGRIAICLWLIFLYFPIDEFFLVIHLDRIGLELLGKLLAVWCFVGFIALLLTLFALTKGARKDILALMLTIAACLGTSKLWGFQLIGLILADCDCGLGIVSRERAIEFSVQFIFGISAFSVLIFAASTGAINFLNWAWTRKTNPEKNKRYTSDELTSYGQERSISERLANLWYTALNGVVKFLWLVVLFVPVILFLSESYFASDTFRREYRLEFLQTFGKLLTLWCLVAYLALLLTLLALTQKTWLNILATVVTGIASIGVFPMILILPFALLSAGYEDLGVMNREEAWEVALKFVHFISALAVPTFIVCTGMLSFLKWGWKKITNPEKNKRHTPEELTAYRQEKSIS